MTTWWRCQACPAEGEGDRAAEQHVRDTRHSVLTSARRQAARYWLTDKGLAALAAAEARADR